MPDPQLSEKLRRKRGQSAPKRNGPLIMSSREFVAGYIAPQVPH